MQGNQGHVKVTPKPNAPVPTRDRPITIVTWPRRDATGTPARLIAREGTPTMKRIPGFSPGIDGGAVPVTAETKYKLTK